LDAKESGNGTQQQPKPVTVAEDPTAWAEGMADLIACCRDRDMTAAVRERRGVNYREALGHLTVPQWKHAVAACREGWFPTIGELLGAATTMPRPPVAGLLTAGDVEAQRAEGRANARRGLEIIEAELKARGVTVKPMVVVATDERLAELRAQAAEVVKA
jgi:hypothetical protein